MSLARVAASAPEAVPATDFARELARLDETIATRRADALVAPTDTETVTSHLDARYRRALLTGDLAALARLEPLIVRGIALIPHPGDLHLLRARLAFHLHRLADVEKILDAVAPARACAEGQVLLAELDFQHGRYAAAAERYEAVIARSRPWAALAGLAYLHSKLGEPARADRLYVEAEDELTAKEMRSYAWLELQRGVLDLAHGRHAEAGAHYARAARAYSGYWLVDEHVAELLAVEGDRAGAAALYERILAAVPRPELHQLVGQLYALMERLGRARSHFVQARAGYRDSQRAGGVHYDHHLADFYAEAMVDGAKAVAWARRDLALRENFSTQAALAWALLRDDRPDEAAQWMERALASGATDAHLFVQAAAIFAAAGLDEKAVRYQHLSRRINPRLSRFHVHR